MATEAQIISKELGSMGDVDKLITTFLPQLDINNPDSVGQLQTLLSLKYDNVTIDGEFGPQTSSMLRSWMSSSKLSNNMSQGADNSLLSAENSNNFVDASIADMVSQTARMQKGSDDVIKKVIDQVSIGDLNEDA